MKCNFKIFTILSFMFLFSGCATIFSGTTQNINIQAVDVNTNKILDNTHCFLIDSKGVHHPVIDNPGTVVVSKGFGAITPHCTKEGYTQKNFGVGNNFNATTLVNILFWPGFFVDAMTGAMNKYPSHITVFMEYK